MAIPSLHTGLPLPGELLARTGPNLVDLFIALAAGSAAGFVTVRTEASGALPGVGIAVALVPPLATIGIAIGLGDWGLAWGALLLFATNLVAIVLAAGAVLVAAGFAAFRDLEGARSASLATKLVWIGLLIVAVPLAFQSWGSATGERGARGHRRGHRDLGCRLQSPRRAHRPLGRPGPRRGHGRGTRGTAAARQAGRTRGRGSRATGAAGGDLGTDDVRRARLRTLEPTVRRRSDQRHASASVDRYRGPPVWVRDPDRWRQPGPLLEA